MKRQLAMLAGALALASAGAASAQALDDKKADELMKKAGCNACHTVDKKLVGPAYKDVAAKHKGQADAAQALFEKVRKGGAGVYGQVPMPPNPADKISDGDLKLLVAWILTK
ncbi:MAG TPA: c-type cytochrome [Burkholderiales bacterium]|nr:c-type cytochrome [Burkholderiales bacterium]